MSSVISPWPALAEQASKKVNRLEMQLRESKAQAEELNKQWLRVTNMVMEYRDKHTELERTSRLADSVNCRKFLVQLIDVSVQAERSYLRAVSVRYAMLTQLKLARIEFEKMKKLVERDKQANKQLADKQAQRSMDELATMRHSWRHA